MPLSKKINMPNRNRKGEIKTVRLQLHGTQLNPKRSPELKDLLPKVGSR